MTTPPRDLKSVDPAVLSSAKAAPRPALREPHFTDSTVVVSYHEETKTTTPATSAETHVVIKCGDKYLAVLREAWKTTPFSPQTSQVSCGIDALQAFVQWCERDAKSPLAPLTPSPSSHTDFLVLLTTERGRKLKDWECCFYQKYLEHDGETLLALINVAETYRKESLLSYCIVCLGCMIRGTTTADVLSTFGHTAPVTEDEEREVRRVYTWYNDLTQVSSR